MPCPISARWAVMVTSPDPSMATKATGLYSGTSWASATAGVLAKPCGIRRRPITRLPVMAAPPIRKARRVTFWRLSVTSRLRRRGLDRLANALIGAAAADVARHGAVDVLVARRWRLGEQPRRLHHLAALTVPTLGHAEPAPGRLDSAADRRAPDRLDGRDRLTGGGRDRCDAGASRGAIQVHGAG